VLSNTVPIVAIRSVNLEPIECVMSSIDLNFL